MKDWFVNYVADDTRESPINLAAVRAILAAYIIWRWLSWDFSTIASWPVHPLTNYSFLVPPPEFAWILVVEQWLLVGLAILFATGYRTRIVGFVLAFLMAHLTGTLAIMNTSGELEQMFLATLVVVFLTLYHDTDVLSVDTFRETAGRPLDELNDHLQKRERRAFSMPGLKWSLLMLAIVYFGASWAKVLQGPVWEWASASGQARFVIDYGPRRGEETIVTDLFLQAPAIVRHISGWAAVASEAALLVAVLLGITITPVIAILLIFHVGVYFLYGLLFLDIMILLCLFGAFDRVYSRLSSSREIDIVYDEHCYFCARVLHVIPHLDTNDRVTFYSQYTAPEEYRGRGVDFEDEMAAFADGKSHGGYDAFRELFRQFIVTVPLAWLMSLSPVRQVGERVYANVAENRDRYFVCSVDQGD